jgi:hypothetical protein
LEAAKKRLHNGLAIALATASRKLDRLNERIRLVSSLKRLEIQTATLPNDGGWGGANCCWYWD